MFKIFTRTKHKYFNYEANSKIINGSKGSIIETWRHAIAIEQTIFRNNKTDIIIRTFDIQTIRIKRCNKNKQRRRHIRNANLQYQFASIALGV